MTVVAVDRNRHGLRTLPAGFTHEVIDATDPGAGATTVERIARDSASRDVLVNTIGTFQTGDPLTTTPDASCEQGPWRGGAGHRLWTCAPDDMKGAQPPCR
jgi:hypothetical protein